MSSSRVIISKVFVSCCLSTFFMEMIMAEKPDTANLVTSLQFLCITLQGLFNLRSVLSPSIPLKHYLILVCLFFATSVANNYVYALHVHSTLHMIIRSAASPASMLVSWYAKSRVPKLTSLIGSTIITIGVITATYGDATIVDRDREGKFLQWSIGVIMLLATLITGAFTGLQQERLYMKYGKHPEEMLFFTHAIPLPLFLGISPQLYTLVFSLSFSLWILILINIVSQFFCSSAVHELATKETSVTVTFILTIRKFVSLLISTIVFKNMLTIYHIVGSVLVFIGTYLYFDFFSNMKQQPVEYKNK